MADINNPLKRNEVVGVSPPARLTDITGALTAAGYEVEVVRGKADPRPADEQLDVDGDEGFGAKILRFFQQGEEQDTLRHFSERLDAGDHLVRVLHVDDDNAETAGQIFADNGGDTIWHYGKWTYTQLFDADTDR